MQPISTTTCTILDSSTTQCVTAEPTSATGTPAVLWHYDAGELVICFLLVVVIAILVFGPLAKIFYANTQ